MSISTSQKFAALDSSANDRAQFGYDFDRNILEVCVSNAEARVITCKAKKAGLSINEYMRQAALGFPIS